MLHSMAVAAEGALGDRPQALVPTILALYTTATLFTALAFFFFGTLESEKSSKMFKTSQDIEVILINMLVICKLQHLVTYSNTSCGVFLEFGSGFAFITPSFTSWHVRFLNNFDL